MVYDPEPEPEPEPEPVPVKKPAAPIPAEFDFSKFGEFERRSHAVGSAPRPRVTSTEFNSLMEELFDDPDPNEVPQEDGYQYQYQEGYDYGGYQEGDYNPRTLLPWSHSLSLHEFELIRSLLNY